MIKLRSGEFQRPFFFYSPYQSDNVLNILEIRFKEINSPLESVQLAFTVLSSIIDDLF